MKTAADSLVRVRLLVSLCALALAACSQVASKTDIEGPRPRDAGRQPEPDAGAREDAGHDAGAPMPVASDEDGGADDDLSCDEQIAKALDKIPQDLDCTGLYLDVPNKILNPAVRPFQPASQLWSDGAGKQRWVYLPPGEKIDASTPGQWIFPVGTKFFKEFRANGRRVETRLYSKVREDRWVRATFAWDRTETQARRNFGAELEDVTLYGRNYHIPSGSDCDQCHDGNRERVLGFSEISLGMPGARGVTLQDLVDEDLISPAPRRTQLSMGDDGTGLAEPALGWLHINCGVSCHNADQNSEAYPSGLRFTLLPNELDGRPPVDSDTYQTAVQVAAKSERFGTDRIRIVPGSPETSLVFQLITSRKGPKDQMPPIATQVVDPDAVRVVEAWIRALD